nr:FtsK/SpoIIIE domain-containing protein [Nanchangia anserum]
MWLSRGALDCARRSSRARQGRRTLGWRDRLNRVVSDQRWRPYRDESTPDHLRAWLGIGEAGAVDVDLVCDGPHALVAGTTGSGKSEALVTWLLGLAWRYPPSQLGLVLVDYKGGETFAALAPLPTCAESYPTWTRRQHGVHCSR